MKITLVGTGDAFGSGGRFNTCFIVDSQGARIAVDFGATSLVALKRMGIDPDSLDAIVLTHLHGDHYGGLPFLMLDYHFDTRRTRPFTVVGPPGTAERLATAQEALYPGSMQNELRFAYDVVELPCETPHQLGPFRLESHAVVHPSGAPSTGLRIHDGACLFAYSGDTAWTDALERIAANADLFIIECYRLAGATPNHLSFETIDANRSRLAARRIMLTHMSAEVLPQIPQLVAKGYLAAEDGLEIEI